MDVYQNLSVHGGFPLEFQQQTATPFSSSSSSSVLEEFFPGANTEGDDVSLQWLSIFVEDCLSCTTTYTDTSTTNHHRHQPPQPQNPNPLIQTPDIPSKSRTKRRRFTPNTTHFVTSPPPLLLHDHHAYWLADSELILPKQAKEETSAAPDIENDKAVSAQAPRRCTHCLSQKTPQWRAGPLGPKTLCNACGVRFKSGRLLPEYRPAKSPTFQSYKHSNSHKKVMEMRMAINIPSNSN